MRTDNGDSVSLWMATADTPDAQALASNVDADVCVVGAGIAGLTTAYLLGREGRRVVVLDDGVIGGGMTARTTAHLSNALDDRFYELERLFGEEASRAAAESHTAAIAQIEAIVAAEEIDCDFERLDGYLFLPPQGKERLLDDELHAAHRAGLTSVRRLARAPLDSFDTGPCLHFPHQGQFHPLRYLAGLARAVVRDGGRIYGGTHATAVHGGSDAYVETAAGTRVRAGAIVVATNTPVNDMVAIHTKQAPYVTYAVGARVKRGAIPTLLLWDAPPSLYEPYHYVRLQRAGDHDVLIVGGEDHKTGHHADPQQCWRNLEQWTRERFPEVQRFEYRWSGQVMEPIDGLAFIGRNPLDDDNVYIATGDSGMGMTHGTIAGVLLTDLIVGRANPWADLYDPRRKTLGAATHFARENVDVMAQYTDLATGGDVASVDDIAPGEGAVLRRGMAKIAVYRDEHGMFHERSALCPHLGCVVKWNGAERTWDCPCHGSRFHRDGHVVQGPANAGLKPVDR